MTKIDDREKYNEYMRNYYKNHSDKMKAANRRYRLKNPHKLEIWKKNRKITVEKIKPLINEMSRQRRDRMKSDILNFLGGKKCHRCGVDNLPVCCYDFHHSNADPKITKIGFLITKTGEGQIHKIKKAVEGCIIVCANCHRIIHKK